MGGEWPAEPRALVAAVARRLYERGLVTSVAGNLSVREGDLVYVTPTGSALGELRADDVVVTDLAGRVLEGRGRPSSELPMHLAILRADPAIVAVVHTHSPVAVAFSVLGAGLSAVTTEAEMLLGEVPLVPYAPPGSAALGGAVGRYVGRHRAVLLERHGVVAWGAGLAEAFHRAELVEETARVHLLVRLLGGGKAGGASGASAGGGAGCGPAGVGAERAGGTSAAGSGPGGASARPGRAESGRGGGGAGG